MQSAKASSEKGCTSSTFILSLHWWRHPGVQRCPNPGSREETAHQGGQEEDQSGELCYWSTHRRYWNESFSTHRNCHMKNGWLVGSWVLRAPLACLTRAMRLNPILSRYVVNYSGSAPTIAIKKMTGTVGVWISMMWFVLQPVSSEGRYTGGLW